MHAEEEGPWRVLVADDDAVNRLVTSARLTLRGLVSWQAADGAEAVALACAMPFDLVLMDLQMPILDGLGATSAIRRFERLFSKPPVPVVAYTSTAPGDDLLAWHGLNGRLGKPCDDHELARCLSLWCPAASRC